MDGTGKNVKTKRQRVQLVRDCPDCIPRTPADVSISWNIGRGKNGKFADRLPPVVNYACCIRIPFAGWAGNTSVAANSIGTNQWRRSLIWSGWQSQWPQSGCGDTAGPRPGEIRRTAREWKRLPWSVSWPFYSRSFPSPTTCTLKPWPWMRLRGSEMPA